MWEQLSEKEHKREPLKTVRLSDKAGSILRLALDVAKMQVETLGEFNPFGIAFFDGQAQVLMVDPRQFGSEGILAKQISRRVEDNIRALRAKHTVEVALIASDVNLRPLEGGEPTSAIAGRLEEKGGVSVQFIQEYRIIRKSVKFGEQTLIPKEHHLLP